MARGIIDEAHVTAFMADGFVMVRGMLDAEETALLVHLLHVLEVRVRDVLGPERVAGEEDGLGVVAGLGTEMNWHARDSNCERIER